MTIDRKQQIIDTGARLAARYGAVNVTRRMIAEKIKVTEALLNRYVGTRKKAQKLYAKRCIELGLKEPSPEKIEQHGINLRKHKVGDVRDTRKRSAKEVKAIKDKKAAPKKASVKVTKSKGKVIVNVSTRKSGQDARSPAVQKQVKAAVKKATKKVAKKVGKSKGKAKSRTGASVAGAGNTKRTSTAAAPKAVTKKPAAARKTAARAPKAPPPLPPPPAGPGPEGAPKLPPALDTLTATI